jgi:hypothetical protein
MTCLVFTRVALFALVAAAGGCASTASPSAEAVSASPVAPAPPIASERGSTAGVPSPQMPAAVNGPPVESPAPPTTVASPVGAKPASAHVTRPASSSPALAGSGASAGVPTSTPSESAPAGGYAGADPCQLATKGDSPVARACREGGIKAAKMAMKDLIKGARATGVRYQCDDCHVNDADYAQLAKGADDKFAKLLAANRK